MSGSRQAPSEDLQFILGKIQELNPVVTLKNESILLTGATGFFGKWLTQALLAMNDAWALGNHLTVVTRDRNKTLANLPWLTSRPDVDFIETDIRHLQSKKSFSSIIHGAAAASQSLNENQPEEMFNTILDGTKRVLALAELGKTRRFQFISSGAIYGPQPVDLPRVPESYMGGPDPLDGRSAYGEAKRAAEFLSANAARRVGFQLTIPRCYAFIGPYLPMDTHFAAGNFLKCILENKSVAINGDGTAMRSYLYAADLAIWLIHILINGDGAYNVGSDQPISIKDLAAEIHRAGCEINPQRKSLAEPVRVALSPKSGQMPQFYVPSASKARNTLHLEAWTSVHEAAVKTLKWELKT